MDLNANHPYAQDFKARLEVIAPGLYGDFSLAAALPEEHASRLLAEILKTGCQAQNFGNIMLGREVAVRLPRAWNVARLDESAANTLDLDDDWELMRAIEIAGLLDDELVKRLASRGFSSPNPEVVEIARAYSS